MQGFWRGVTLGLFLCAVTAARPTGAQTVRNLRLNVHPTGSQVGIVTQVAGKTAWIRLPARTMPGVTVDFMAFSDGGDTLARGRVQWVSPIAPYEAYVVEVEPIVTSHAMNDIDDLASVALIFRLHRRQGARPETDGFASPLSAGFFARVSVEPEREEAGVVEPVRAYIAALRAQKDPIADAIAAAAERALGKDPLSRDEEDDLAVNFAALADNLKRFRRLKIEHPITNRLLRRLYDHIDYHGAISEPVPTDFLRPAGELTPGPGTLPGMLRR